MDRNRNIDHRANALSLISQKQSSIRVPRPSWQRALDVIAMSEQCESRPDRRHVSWLKAQDHDGVTTELFLIGCNVQYTYPIHKQKSGRSKAERDDHTKCVHFCGANESKVHVMQVMRGKSKHFYPEIAYFGQEGGKRGPPSSSGLSSPGFCEVPTPEVPSGESSAPAGASSSSIFETVGASGAFVCSGTPV